MQMGKKITNKYETTIVEAFDIETTRLDMLFQTFLIVAVSRSHPNDFSAYQFLGQIP